MLNPNAKYEKKETVSFPLLKNDVYQVELVDIKEEESRAYKSEEMENKFSFEFVVLSGKDSEGKEARLRLLSKNFVPTFLYISSKNGKNWLYKIVEALLDRELTKEEEAIGISGELLNSLIGKQCRVLLEKAASKKDASKFYSNIANILSADGMSSTPLSVEDKKRIQEIKEGNNKDDRENQSNVALAEEHEMAEGQEIRPEDIPF